MPYSIDDQPDSESLPESVRKDIRESDPGDGSHEQRNDETKFDQKFAPWLEFRLQSAY